MTPTQHLRHVTPTTTPTRDCYTIALSCYTAISTRDSTVTLACDSDTKNSDGGLLTQITPTRDTVVEAAVRRQFISARRPSRDSRYAAFLCTHCAYTLFSHMCHNRYPPHVDSNILYSTLLLALLFGCVVYASATVLHTVQSGIHLSSRAQICKPLKEPRNQFPAWRSCTTNLF